MAEAATADLTGTVLFAQPLILLCAAVALVPIFKKLGLGSILGYLAAGVLIGPIAQIITDTESIAHVAELGVVLFLFIVGLELRPNRLWAMRRYIFGLGLAQLAVTGMVLTGILSLLGWRIEPALIIGFALALSSTAFGVQILNERNELNTPYGRKAFAILLFQDIAIVPLLAAVSLLAPDADDGAAFSLTQFAIAIVATALLLFAGRFLLNPFFRLLASTRANEIMTAAALLVVLGAAALMQFAGLSMALGAFVAGVMLADSSFRHELEANIEPFRGLLLGLFFMSVGMSIQVGSLVFSWWQILIAVPILMSVKAAILYGLARLFGSAHNDAIRVALLLPQAGEFAFVIFTAAVSVRALWPSETNMIAAIVTVSLALTPLTVALTKRFLHDDGESDDMEEDFEGSGGEVLIIGFGRFGQIVSQVLLARNVNTTIIDANAERVREAARFGSRIYFGVGTRLDVLRAAGADEAEVICICVDNPQTIDTIVDLVRTNFPDTKIYARSWDRAHTLELIAKGVDYEVRETFLSALDLGGATLHALGFSNEEAATTVGDISRRDNERLALQQTGDIYSGRDMLITSAITPEPLVPPHKHPPVADEAVDDEDDNEDNGPDDPPAKASSDSA